ncbi:MAG: endonuclease III [Candidatus Bathyarchaeia archaeon]
MEKTVSAEDKEQAQQILKVLRERIPLNEEDFAASRVAKESGDPFRVLVVTILSQNCTDIAALRAYGNLDRTVGVSVSALSSARVRTIEKAIHVAGLHKQKAKALKQLARIVDEKYSGNFAAALDGSFERVRESLQELPNVGPKTADVLLSIWGRPTISVDTHVDRVSKRLGLARTKARYGEIRSALMQEFLEEDYRSVPLYFMALGRMICKAQRPLCPRCPINNLCPYEGKTKPN